jgi:predicted secreted protein
MPSAAVAGFIAVIQESSDGGSNYFTIGELRDFTLEIESDEINAFSKDSGSWDEFINGRKRWRGRGSALYLEGNTAQDALYNAMVNQTSVLIRIRPKGTLVGNKQFIGTAVVTGFSTAMPNDDATAVDVTVSGKGALALSTQ